MTTKTPRVYSDLAIPPGETLAEELEVRGMTPRELAVLTNCPEQVIDQIIQGEKAITPDIALALGDALRIEAQFWTNLEADYQTTLARQRERAASVAEQNR